MKLLNAIILAIALLGAPVLTGCRTTSQADLNRIKSAAKVAAYIGTEELLRSHPGNMEVRQRFLAAREALIVLENAPTVDYATLLAIVQRLPIKDIQSDRARMLITASAILLSDYAGELPLEQMGNLRVVAKAIREGIDLGL